jgi:aldose 1-epimerase
VKRQLPINEVPRQNALHGLVSWAQWQLEFHSQHELTMSYDLPARPGWPFLLSFKVTYSMNDDGLTCSFEVTNRGKEVAPYGSGFHPWLSTGGALLDECDVQLDVATHITVDERLLPTGTEPVSGDYDLRVRRSLKGLDLDDAWIDPGVGPDGLTWCKLFCPDGAVPAVWADSSMPAWQVCSADHIPAHYRFGLAAEPMTCVANAFNTGDLLIELQPGVTHTVRWGATLLSD